MAEGLDRFAVSEYGSTRVSAEFGLEGYSERLVTVRVKRDNGWQLEMSPRAARKLARQLNAVAKLLDPPKPRA